MNHAFPMPQKPTTFNKAVGERLKLLQEVLGLEQAQFAKLLGISPQALSNAKKGVNAPRAETMVALKTEKHITLDYVYTGDRSALPHKLAVSLTPKPTEVQSATPKQSKRRVA